jgi:hypothetical protein
MKIETNKIRVTDGEIDRWVNAEQLPGMAQRGFYPSDEIRADLKPRKSRREPVEVTIEDQPTISEE